MIPCATDVDSLVGSLSEDDPIGAALGQDWQRSYGRLRHGDEARATLVYEHPQAEPVLVEIEAGQARMQPMRADPALPTLSAALDRHPMAQVVRYRPGKRCTFAATRSDGRRAYFKTLADDRGSGIWDDARDLAAVAARGELDFTVAEPAAYDNETRTISHFALPGAPAWPVLFSAQGVPLAARIGTALGSLPASTLPCRLQFMATDQLRRSARYARQFARLLPELHAPIESFITLATQAHARHPDGAARPIHGAPHPQQWLLGTRVGLVDFDRVGSGPVELDAATFVAELDFESLDDGLRESLSATFLAAYAERVGGLDAARLDLYRAHKHFAKAFKTAAAIRSDRRERSAQILAGAVALAARWAA